jgi:hypothetical protein
MKWLKSKNWISGKEENKYLKDKRKPAVLSKAQHQTGETTIKRDRTRKALPPGKRLSKSGKVYYEYRKNRSDILGEKI